ncbi:MAG: hypothetical protein LAP61_22855 [Acidobacteriia bacterium]|nr:hypothetical protein [Terriglobia bacterium]
MKMMRLHGPLFFLVIVLFSADVPIQCALNSIAFPNLHWVALIIIAMLVAAGIGAVVEVSAFALLFDPYRLLRTFRLCLTCAGLAGIFAAVSGTMLLFSRTAGGNIVDFLVQAVPIAFWTLGESLPIAAGFLSAAVWTLGYPKRRDRQIKKLKSRLSELGRFLDWLENDIQKHASKVVTMVLACCLLAAPAFSQGGVAPPSGATSGSATAKAQPNSDTRGPGALTTPARDKIRCLVASDMTDSVDPEYRRLAVARFIRTVYQFITAFQCAGLSATTFADEGPYSPLTEIEAPLRPAAEDCSKATFTANGMDKITQNISGFQTYYRKRAEEACQVATQSRLADLDLKTQELTKRVAAVLNPDLPTRGQCTAIYGLISWAVRRNNVIILISDGLETCEQVRPAFQLPSDSRLFLILLPSRSLMHKNGRSALQIATGWETIVRGLKVVMPTDVTPDLWSDLASTGR